MMSDNQKQDDALDVMLKKAYQQIEPLDSWASLRARVDRRIHRPEGSRTAPAPLEASVVFWRRAALGTAACLALAVGLLVYQLAFVSGPDDLGPRAVASGQRIFNEVQLDQLSRTFANVRELFGRQSTWMMVSSDDDTEVGVEPVTGTTEGDRAVVVRLEVDLEKRGVRSRYFDIVTPAGQAASFRLSIDNASTIDIRLKPLLRPDGLVQVDLGASIKGGSEARSVTAVGDDSYTPLIRLRANGAWARIDGIARSMPNI
ncbi:MAG: hypothetical protein ACYTEL_10930 [Planctomycetota bacterium]|jgi:hypothetical protein